MSAPMLIAEGLKRCFVRPAQGGLHEVLRGASLRVSSGEAVAIVGPSGSGKTTLIHLLSGLDVPEEGSVSIAGHLMSGQDEDKRAALRARHVGLVLQHDQLLVQCTALENVLLPTLHTPRSETAALKARAEALLESVGLADLMAHRPAQLSAGQRQRVALARALIRAPDVLLADEPTGALDRASSSALLEVLESVRAHYATAMVIVTHDEAVVARMDRALALRDGRLESRSS